MSSYSVIADVGDTLKKLLWENMKADPKIYPDIIDSEDDITLLSPSEMDSGDTKKLSLFLYQIAENAYLRNEEIQNTDSERSNYIPLVLDLFYLITPKTNDSKKDHILLGKVMQTIYDNSVVKGSILQGCLAGTMEELRVTVCSLPFEEMIHLWQSFSEKSFKLSICYQVTPVKIDSIREIEDKKVVKKEAIYYQMAIKRDR